MEIIKANDGKNIWYRVQKNDTLESIASNFNISAASIMRNNPTIELYEGEMVKILFGTKTSHVVKPMETLASIAQKYNVGVEQIVKINNLTSHRVFIGQILQINN